MALKYASVNYVNEENFDVGYGILVVNEVTMNFGSGKLFVKMCGWKDAESRMLGVDPVQLYQEIPVDYFNDPVISPIVSDVSDELWNIIRQHPLIVDYTDIRTGGQPVLRTLDELGAVITDMPEGFM